MPDTVFISYKSEQLDIARRVRDVVRATKRPTWFDQDDIPEDAYFRGAIDEGLHNAAIIVGIFTQAALNSREVKFEWNYAVSGKARLILLRYEALDLPYWLEGVQYIDCLKDERAGLAQLQSALAENPAPTAAPHVRVPAPDRAQGFPAYVSPVLPDEQPQRQRKRHRFRIALWVILLCVVLMLGRQFGLDDSTFAIIAIVFTVIFGIVAIMPSNASTEAAIKKSADPIRAAILENVHQAWIEGVLRPNLPAGALDLGLALRPEAVLRHVDYGDYKLPNSSGEIARIFTDMHGELLILGAPGAGKTILLLQLTEQLLGRAQHDPLAPLPLVFNLASWREGTRFADWLVEELRRSYGVPEKAAAKLVEVGRLALLLDGLDELAVSDDMMPGADATDLDAATIALRAACIQAINVYREAHAEFLEIAVCSRLKDYDALSTKLDLKAAILLSALSDAQIQTYLAGDDHAGTRELLAQEAAAQQFAASPLLLSIMKQSYQGERYEGSPHRQLKLAGDDSSARQQHLFNAYLRQRLSATGDAPYSPQQTRHYLRWLAHQMVRHKQTVFYIESLQPDWAKHERGYRWSVGLSFGLIFGLSGGLSGGLSVGLLARLIFGLSVGLLFGLSGRLTRITLPDKVSFSFSRDMLLFGLSGGLSFGLIFGLSFGLIGGLSFGLIGGLIVGLNTEAQPQLRRDAGAGFRSTLQYILRIGLIVGLSFGLIGGLSAGLLFGLSFGLSFGLIGGLTRGGGQELIKHIALRLVLMREGVVPRRPHWRYDRFLDHCAELGLLRKVGGGYIFRHRLLLEHLAQEQTSRETG